MNQRYFLLVVLVVFLSLLGCVPHEVPTPLSVPVASPAEEEGEPLPAALIDELVLETEGVRQLELLEAFDSISVTEEFIRVHVRRELADVEMTTAERIMVAFGFVPEGTDLTEMMVELMGAEVLGLYDPRENRLMVLDTVVASLGSESLSALESRAVLVHEIVHAFQDQHFDTLDHQSDEAWADDARSVYGCLAEGDATLAMLVAMFRASGLPIDITTQPGFREQARTFSQAAVPSSAALSAAPPYFGYVLTATYFEGLTFAADLRRVGGWAAVDAAHRNPPRCTRDILHPEHYLSGHRLFEITLPETLPGLTEPTYRRVHEATLGELETGAFLLPLSDDERMREAATGWAGDRFVVVETTDGDLALAWRLRFETQNDAGELFEAALEVHVATGRGPCRGQFQERDGSDAAPRVAMCSEGRDRLVQRGVDVALARNVPSESAEALVDALLAAPVTERAVDPPQPGLTGQL